MTTQDFTVAHDGRTTSGVKYFPACGRFPVVVFAHGYNGEARDFAPFAEFLAKNGIGAVIFTFSGGSTRDESGFLTTDMTLSTEQEDLVAVMGEAQKMAGAEALFLFGGSQGGFVSALVAEQHGEEIAGLMLLYPAFCIPDDWRRRFCGQAIPETLELWGMTLGKGGILIKGPCSFCTAMKIRSLPFLTAKGRRKSISAPSSKCSRAKGTAFRRRACTASRAWRSPLCGGCLRKNRRGGSRA